jgi:hypothetical protein
MNILHDTNAVPAGATNVVVVTCHVVLEVTPVPVVGADWVRSVPEASNQ